MATTAGSIRIGISGWRYKPWRGVFYPPDLPQRCELEYASRRFGAIELNGSFYSLQWATSYTKWYEQTPDDFKFAIKAPRYITHIKRLRDIDAPMANFFASGLFNLQHKLGPLLWQFPPSFKFNPELIEAFFAMLPHDTAAALKLARKHEAFMRGRTALSIDENRPVRHAMEVRNESFIDARFVELLREHQVALVIADTAGRWPLREDVTSDFVYMRLHGEKSLYTSGYSAASLDRWAKRIAAWSCGSQPRDARLIAKRVSDKQAHDVFCFFDNTDLKLKAPFDAAGLAERLGVQQGEPVKKYGRIPSRAPKKKVAKKNTAKRDEKGWRGTGADAR